MIALFGPGSGCCWCSWAKAMPVVAVLVASAKVRRDGTKMLGSALGFGERFVGFDGEAAQYGDRSCLAS
jgi:hypothetical protein